MSDADDMTPVTPASLSELERMIHRLATQRACLDYAVGLVADVPGPVLELGLGKGRTYDHLRHRLPGREIFAFDRHLHAALNCVPSAEHLVLGELFTTLQTAPDTVGAPAALVHADIGTVNPEADARAVAALAPLIDALVCTDAVIVSDREMTVRRWRALPLPDEATWPYFMYRVEAGDW
ncbi:MAG: hypothetical protein GWN84_24060 [Gammaproteobacteria bacterium]|nr:hypothetical protein [Gammaproteobacteria bacterium]NIR85658.1 hypothetical protein [Gammaproteobacteria bacterium]NIR90146.1 hypothetical protein [Gammaproteobacteria bacterium]NIU06792.1 hypothetical protein [Gammaproteobacteria bacterium]NIV53725.1 hypothetical protein [Gammaproteobacteria bacterium]